MPRTCLCLLFSSVCLSLGLTYIYTTYLVHIQGSFWHQGFQVCRLDSLEDYTACNRAAACQTLTPEGKSWAAAFLRMVKSEVRGQYAPEQTCLVARIETTCWTVQPRPRATAKLWIFRAVNVLLCFYLYYVWVLDPLTLFTLFLFFSSFFFFPFWVVEICNINPAARMTLRANWPGPVKLPWAVEEFLRLQQVREGLVFPCRVTSEPISGAAPWLLSQALTQWLYMTSWKIRSQTVAWRGTDQTVLQALFSLK